MSYGIARTLSEFVMPAKTIPGQTIQFSVTLSAQAVDMIEQLTKIGLYGTSRGEVARNLISGRLEQLIAQGLIKIPTGK